MSTITVGYLNREYHTPVTPIQPPPTTCTWCPAHVSSYWCCDFAIQAHRLVCAQRYVDMGGTIREDEFPLTPLLTEHEMLCPLNVQPKIMGHGIEELNCPVGYWRGETPTKWDVAGCGVKDMHHREFCDDFFCDLSADECREQIVNCKDWNDECSLCCDWYYRNEDGCCDAHEQMQEYNDREEEKELEENKMIP
jgi:hypothetical protein